MSERPAKSQIDVLRTTYAIGWNLHQVEDERVVKLCDAYLELESMVRVYDQQVPNMQNVMDGLQRHCADYKAEIAVLKAKLAKSVTLGTPKRGALLPYPIDDEAPRDE